MSDEMILKLLGMIFRIIRDYSTSTYTLSYVCKVAQKEMSLAGYTVETPKRNVLAIDGEQFLIYKPTKYSCDYDVRHISST